MFRRAMYCLAAMVATAAPGLAVTCTIDQVPGATLLLPYFEVDLNHPQGSSTTFSINNASDQEHLAKVEVWTDLGVPVFGFDVYLTAYGLQRVDLRDILTTGRRPQTAPPAGHFPSCAGELPLSQLPASKVQDLQASFTGHASTDWLGKCGGLSYGDGVARGYVTVDVVRSCTTLFQGSPGYFGSGGTGTPTDDNVLWGDFALSNPSQGISWSEALVQIEADPTATATTLAGEYTFYGALVNWTASDNREPLSTKFAARYLVRGRPVTPRTDLLVWRDPKTAVNPFACAGKPAFYPMPNDGATVFDEAGHSTAVSGSPFPAVAQRVRVGGPVPAAPATRLPTPYGAGWARLDLNRIAPSSNVPPVDPEADQAWVVVVSQNGPTYSVGLDATRLDSACDVHH